MVFDYRFPFIFLHFFYKFFITKRNEETTTIAGRLGTRRFILPKPTFDLFLTFLKLVGEKRIYRHFFLSLSLCVCVVCLFAVFLSFPSYYPCVVVCCAVLVLTPVGACRLLLLLSNCPSSIKVLNQFVRE